MLLTPLRNLLIVNTNNLIARVRLIPRDKVSSDRKMENMDRSAEPLT